ncbi:homogentisate 1,2-dioxygenase, partial [Mycobacteroides abscessus subsp. abscessus]|nr:homogentisate 1,2-dioxygenase [Mycobacteroides abscessus subsp. abscessus]
MAHYMQVGSIPPKRHTQHRNAAGNLYYEELVGEDGFSSDSALLYHRHIPAAIVDATPWELLDHSTCANRPLIPRHRANAEIPVT